MNILEYLQKQKKTCNFIENKKQTNKKQNKWFNYFFFVT